MKAFIRSIIAVEHGVDFADKITFAPVPKGKDGDIALAFFTLSKETKQSPMAIGTMVQVVLQAHDDIESAEMVGPYLNVSLTPARLFEYALKAKTKSEILAKKKIVLEYSGPNTNKPLHLGHMRNHALGISIGNILEAAGASVHRVNIINDRGVHICKSMLAYEKHGKGETPESTNEKSDHLVGKYYVKYSEEEKQNPEIKAEVQQMLVDWEAGKDDVIALWKKMNSWALQGHAETYKRQGVAFEKAYKESDYYTQGRTIAESGVKKGVFFTRADGAICIDLEAEKLGEKVVLRADGTSIYLTQDLAVAVARKDDFEPTDMVYVVADEQNYHFKVLFSCLEKLNLIDKKHLTHMGYGLVHLPDGRMKSREGNVIDADTLMDELSAVAAKKVQEHSPEMSDADASFIAEEVMNAAWKFTLLSTSPKKSMTYSPDDSISFEGASGPYLQYAGVRLQSLFSKIGKDIKEPIEVDASAFGANEKPLGSKVLEYIDVLELAAERMNPTYIVTYLLELAQLWSSFYAQHSVLKADTEKQKIARLALGQKVFEVLQAGLHSLGIKIPTSM